jgi:hypothetical protein
MLEALGIMLGYRLDVRTTVSCLSVDQDITFVPQLVFI